MPEDAGTEVSSRYEAIESSSADQELTPLAQLRGRKQPDLIDTPEPNMSWYSKLMFSWSNDFLRKGGKRQLDYPDMYVLEHRDTPVPNWSRYLKHRKAGRPLMVTLLLTFAPELLAQLGMATLAAILKFAGPFFLQRILRSIDILGTHKDEPASKSVRGAYLDAFGLLFFSILTSQLTNQVLWIGRHIGMRIKGMLVAELSTKTLRRRGKGSWEDEKKPSDDEKEGEEDEPETAQAAADGKIMNLLTADFQRVTEVAAYMDQLYSLPLSLVVGIWYMYQLLGISALV
ncbi:Transporter of the ATP-binding cassette (ABC), partial [Linderina pennispora]